MLRFEKQSSLDAVDISLLRLLQKNGRMSNAELASEVNLSPPATHARVKRLEREGFIEQYTAKLNRRKVGYDNLCFVELSLQLHQHKEIESFLSKIAAMPEVLECYNITGESDYLLKVAIRNTEALEAFISSKLIPQPGLAKIHTSLVLKEVKTTTELNLDHNR